MAVKIKITNYGPIKSATIALADLTVLAGVNASGKSTIAKLFHTIVEINRNYLCKADRAAVSEGSVTKKLLALSQSFEKIGVNASEIVRWLTDIHFEKPGALEQEWEAVKQSISQKCANLETDSKVVKDKRWCDAVGRLLGEDFSSANDILSWFEAVMDEVKNQSYAYRSGEKSDFVYAVGLAAEDFITYGIKDVDIKVYDDDSLVFDNKKFNISRNPIYSPDCSIYLRADRLSVPIREGGDGVKIGNDLYRTGLTKNTDQSISDLLESMMKGKLDKHKNSTAIDNEWLFSGTTRGESFEIPLRKAADGMRAIAPLSILDKYNLLNPNTLLIVDEPESHLHPQWIVDVAEILIRLVKERNVRVLVATHSPYLIRALKTASMRDLKPGQLKYYLAKSYDEKDESVGYVYKCLNEDIASIFKEFNVALDKISFYE